MKLDEKALLAGSIMMFLAIAIGAFGSHALHEVLIKNGRIDVFATASNYHFYPALALLLLGSIFQNSELQFRNKQLIVWLMLVGTVVFSGSLYLLAIFNISWLGAITPIGGIMLLLCWWFMIKGLIVKFLYKTID